MNDFKISQSMNCKGGNPSPFLVPTGSLRPDSPLVEASLARDANRASGPVSEVTENTEEETHSVDDGRKIGIEIIEINQNNFDYLEISEKMEKKLKFRILIRNIRRDEIGGTEFPGMNEIRIEIRNEMKIIKLNCKRIQQESCKFQFDKGKNILSVTVDSDD